MCIARPAHVRTVSYYAVHHTLKRGSVPVCCCSIGIDDVMPREKLLAEKAKTLDKGYTNVQVRT